MSPRTENDIIDLLRDLTLAPGVPGSEEAVADLVRDRLAHLDSLAWSRDRLGSIIATREPAAGSGPRVLLDAHLDEVGFLVQSIQEEGTLTLVPLGGWWPHVLLAQRVDVRTEGGEMIAGVIGSRPPHFLKPEERKLVQSLETLYVDVGAADRKEAESWGLRIGDPVIPRAEFLPLKNERILSSKAFDDRVGVGLLVETLLALEGVDHPNTVIGVGAVQEEVGCRGAGTAAEAARPDVGIVLEGTPADDTPGFPPSGRQARLGEGPQIRFYDPTAISNRRLVRFLEEVAGEEEIPVQIAVRRSGGTDARSIHLHRSGVPTVVLGIPARYIHTHVSLVHLDDYLAAARLLEAVILRLDADTVAGLTPS